jgi:hypothetical protein
MVTHYHIKVMLVMMWSLVRHAAGMQVTAMPQLTSAQAFLRPLLSSTPPLVEKQALVQALQGLRAQESDGSVNRVEKRGERSVWNGDKASFLDLLLAEMDSSPRILAKSIGRTLNFLPSYRVKLGALQRVVQLILSEESENVAFSKVLLKCENVEELTSYRMSRRRRALSIVLGQLQGQAGIHSLEREARARALRSNTMAEMLDRTPALETPKYSVVGSNDVTGWEVRQYDSFSVCSMSMNDGGPAQDGPAGGGGGFNNLAAYIFGKNIRDGAPVPMKMTTPVISSGGGAETGGPKKMSFVMPSTYWDTNLSAAPKPVDPSVVVEAWAAPASRDAAVHSSPDKPFLAVKWFGGYCSPREVERQAKLLREMIATTRVKGGDSSGIPVDGAEYEYEICGEQVLMQYNDPFQPPWRRRNEVAFPVVRK